MTESHPLPVAAALGAFGIGTFIWDLESGAFRCNDALAQVLGVEGGNGAVDGSVLRSTVRPEDLAELDVRLEAAAAEGTPVHHLVRVVDPRTGRDRRVSVRAQHQRQDGRLTLVGILTDVTARDEATESLRLSEERHRLIFEHNPVPMFINDARDGRFLLVNRAAAQLLHRSVAELERLAPYDIVDERLHPLLDEILASTDTTVHPVGILPVRLPDGSLRQVECTVDRSELDGVPVLVLAAVDVTERLEMEAALRESELVFRAGFESAATPTALLDGNAVFTRVNAAFAQLFRRPAEQFVGKSLLDITPRGDAERDRYLVERLCSGSVPALHIDRRFVRQDGTDIFGRLSVAPVQHDRAGFPKLLMAELVDQTALRETIAAIGRQQEHLAAQNALLDSIIGSIPIFIAFYRLDGTLQYVNRHWEETIGWTAQEMSEPDAFNRLFPDPEYRAAVFAKMQTDINGWSDWVVRTRDGRDIHTSWTSVRLPDGRLIGIGRDITDQRAADAARDELERQVQQSQKLESLGLLAGGIAHDFNNLLVGMLGNANLAEEELPAGSAARELVGEVRAAAARASDLTRQLLAYAGKGRFVVEPVDLSQLVQEMANLLRAAISKDAKLRPVLAGGLPVVEADATQLRQIVMNLITNASDALEGKPGTIHLRTALAELDDDFRRNAIGGTDLGPGPHVLLEVQDSGRGMDGATADRIFDPFFTTKRTGRGLGLAATLGIVRSHRGAIQVKSAPEKGTTVRLVLPGRVGTSTPMVGSVQAIKPEWKGSGTVLVADDEEFVRRVTRRALERVGFTVEECNDGREAVDLVAKDPARYALVVLDLTMPRLTGDAALREIRGLAPNLPAILCSGYSAEELDPALTALPGVRFLQKPYTVEQLGTAARGAINETG